MALVTIQRSPTPSTDPELDINESSEDTSDGRTQLRKRPRTSKEKLRKIFRSMCFISKLRPCLSESYFTVKGAALILPHTDCTKKSTKKSHGGEIQSHLQAMLHLLRPEDTIKIAVRLEDTCQYQRYMALVSTRGRQDTEEAVILGIDCTSTTASIGLVLPMWMGLRIKLGGDGGFSLCSDEQSHLFKPVSVQAMWSAIQSLYKVLGLAEDMKYISEGLTHTWIGYYRSRIDNRDSARMCQWNVEGVEIFAPSSLSIKANDGESERLKLAISQTLKEVMMTFDLDEVTSIMLRNAVEQKMGISLTEYKRYFDEEIMRIVGQMDEPSKILDFLYLGSEWNASNLEELIEKGIGYILNVTKEIDNFFEGMFQYYNVRVYDVDESDLLKHWDKTYKFISKARSHDSKVLVHCKMGVSRSASTVMAFIMKDQRLTVDEAFQFVKERRSCAHPNSGFMEQLRTYEGFLQREQSLLDDGSKDDAEPSQGAFLGDSLFHMMSHTDWQSASEGVACEEECVLTLCKEELYNVDILPVVADLEAMESRSADSIEDAPLDQPSRTSEVVVTILPLEEPSCSVTAASPLPVTRIPDGVPTSDREMTQERDTASEVESYTVLSVSDGSNSLQLRNSLSALCSRIKPDSSWIRPDDVQLDKGDSITDTLSFLDSLPCDSSYSITLPNVSVLGTNKTNVTVISQLEVFKPTSNTTIGESKAVLEASLPTLLSLSSASGLHARSLSPEKPAAGGLANNVQFYIGSIQNNMDLKPTVVSNTDPSLSSSSTTTISTSAALTFGQRLSPDLVSFPSEQLTSPDIQNIDMKHTQKEQLGTLINNLQKEALEKSTKSRDTNLDKLETGSKGEGQEVSGHINISARNPQSKIEPGVSQYFFKERIPWKPGKVRKMQEDINKTGHISQDEDDEEDRHKNEGFREVTILQDVIDERTLLEQTCEHQPAVSLCPSHSCVELSSSEESESVPMSLYEREEIPLIMGKVLRTRLEIEERQRLFCGDGDREHFVTTHPVVRSSSLKQERNTPLSKYKDNRRLTCGPIMSPLTGKSIADLQSVGVSYESFVNPRPPALHSSGQSEDSDEDLADTILATSECHSILHMDRLDEPAIEAGLVRKQKMELESKYETDKTQFRSTIVATIPSTIKSSTASTQDAHNSFRTIERHSTDDTDISQLDSLSSCTSFLEQHGTRLNLDSEILFHEIDYALLMSPDHPPQQGDEPCENIVKYIVRKIENQAVVSTNSRNIVPVDDTKYATSPIKDQAGNSQCLSASDDLIRSNVSSNVSVATKTKADGFPPLSSTASIGECLDCCSRAKNVQPEIQHDVIQMAKTNSLSNVESSSSNSSRMGVDLKTNTHSSLQPHLSSQTLEDIKNISLSSSVNRVKEHLAALAETARSEPISSPCLPPSQNVEHESPEPSVVKHLVGRFENRSPESDRVSSDSNYDSVHKLKDIRDTLPLSSLKSQKEEHPRLLSSLEESTQQNPTSVSQPLFRPIDHLPQPYSSSATSIDPLTSALSASTHLSLYRKHVSLDSAQNPSTSSKSTSSSFGIAAALPSDIDTCSIKETSSKSPSGMSTKKLGPVPFNRSIIENLERRSWRSVRPKSADPIQCSESYSEQDRTSSDIQQRPVVRASYDSFSEIDNNASLRQVSDEGRKIRRLQGKSHPLSKLSEHSLGKGPFYSSM